MKIIITKLEITSFGCLKNKTLTPKENINEITAPNESGKSTTAAFIKFMFYGFNGTKKDIIDCEKKLYLPWDSSVASGALELSADGTLYRIERKYAPSQKEHLEIIEVLTGKSVYSGLCPGEVFFGVDVETAEKTFIFDQYSALGARDSELFDSIRNIIFSGDENSNSEKALKRLKDAKKELKNTRGGGMIDTLEKEFAQYKSAYDESMSKLSSLKDINEQIATLKKNIERNAVNEKKLLAEKENVEKYNAYLKLCELRELEIEAVNAENAYNIAVASLEGAGIPDGELLDYLVSVNAEKISLSTLKDELNVSLSKAEREQKELDEKSLKTNESTSDIKEKLSSLTASGKKSLVFGALFGLLGIACLICGMFFSKYALYGSIPLFAVSVVFLVLGLGKNSNKKKYVNSFGVESESELFALLSNREETDKQKAQKENEIISLNNRIKETDVAIKNCDEKLNGVLGRYFKDSSENSSELIKRLRVISQRVAEAKKIAESKKEALTKTALILDKTALEEKSKGAVTPERPIEEIEKQLRFVQSGMKLMEDKIIYAEKEKAVTESSVTPPSLLYEKAQAVYNKLTLAKERLSALELAIDLIEKAGEEMKASLAPKITSYASELFQIATDGKYTSLNVTTELSLTTDNGETVKSAEYLSAGARVTAYICLRLALLKVIYNDTFPPIIFDDAFVRLDKKRYEQIFKAIMSSPAKDTQIFIFSF